MVKVIVVFFVLVSVFPFGDADGHAELLTGMSNVSYNIADVTSDD